MSFPISPTNGQTTTVNGVLYTYNSTTTAWNVTTAFTGNIVTTTLSATGTVTGASVVGGVITGTSLSASGNVTGGNVTTAGIGNIGTLAVTGTTTLTGNTTAGHLLPAANITYDLGSATAQWRTLYVSGNTINMGGATIQTDTGSGSFAFVPPATAASPNPTGVVFGPGGNISTVSTTAGTITANLQVAGSTTSTILKITSIGYPNDDTAADTAGGQTITLGGSGFLSGAQVLIGTSPMTTVGSVTVVSAVSITFVSPAGSSGNYPVYVVNSDGATAIALPGIAYSGTPTWSTASGNIAQVYEVSSTSTTVTATGDAPISYSVFSGSLPTSVSLNSSTGVISGTTVATASSTTYSFTIRATDAEKQDTNRAFTITVIPDVVTWSSPAADSTATLGLDVVMSNVTMVATSAAGFGIVYTANTLPTGVSITSANIAGTPTVTANTSSLLTATANTSGRTSTRVVNWIVSVASVAPPTVEYLVVAGGGPGGGGRTGGYGAAGGGAGGYLTATGLAVASGSAITVTVGAGGAGASGDRGTQGGNSVFSTITSTGGGVGGAGYPSERAGGNGGSGGGQAGAGAVGTGVVGPPRQGYNGGNGDAAAGFSGGGGGGAGAVGGNTPANYTTGGNGGVGVSSDITGTGTYYAGGGGGGTSNAGTGGNGGNGGGGGGSSSGVSGSNGTANTGGGGGASAAASGTGQSGGSGVVIIRYADTYAEASSTTGSPTVTTTGGYIIYTWTTSGSITF